MTRIVLLLVGVLLAVACAPWLGAELVGEQADWVWWNLRWPRVVLGALVGLTLALVGASFQVVLENPLATPSTVGTTAGASVGALLVLVCFPQLASLGAVSLGAFAGAAMVSFLIASLATTRGIRMEDLLLAGIAVTLASSALVMGLQLQADANTTLAAVRWSLGSLATVGWGKVYGVAPLALLGCGVILTQGRALQALVGGQDRAATQGVNLAKVRVLVLGMGSLAVGACVAACGPIAFVGLIVPHLVSRSIGGGPRTLIPLSGIAGAGFLPLADGLARVLLVGRELPVGVLTATLGAPVLLWLLLSRR